MDGGATSVGHSADRALPTCVAPDDCCCWVGCCGSVVLDCFVFQLVVGFASQSRGFAELGAFVFFLFLLVWPLPHISIGPLLLFPPR